MDLSPRPPGIISHRLPAIIFAKIKTTCWSSARSTFDSVRGLGVLTLQALAKISDWDELNVFSRGEELNRERDHHLSRSTSNLEIQFMVMDFPETGRLRILTPPSTSFYQRKLNLIAQSVHSIATVSKINDADCGSGSKISSSIWIAAFWPELFFSIR